MTDKQINTLAANIKQGLVNMAANDTLPMDMTQLGTHWIKDLIRNAASQSEPVENFLNDANYINQIMFFADGGNMNEKHDLIEVYGGELQITITENGICVYENAGSTPFVINRKQPTPPKHAIVETPNTSDIFVKDEGDFCTVHLQTEKAKQHASTHIAGLAEGQTSFTFSPDNLSKLLAWAISHNLTMDSEVFISTPASPNPAKYLVRDLSGRDGTYTTDTNGLIELADEEECDEFHEWIEGQPEVGDKFTEFNNMEIIRTE